MTTPLESRLSAALGAPAMPQHPGDWSGLANQALDRVAIRTRRARLGRVAALVVLVVGAAALISLASPESTTIETTTLAAESFSAPNQSALNESALNESGLASSAAAGPLEAVEGQSTSAAERVSIDVQVETRVIEVQAPWLLLDLAPKATAVLGGFAVVLGAVSWLRRRRMSRPMGLAMRLLVGLVVVVVAAVAIFSWTFKVFFIPSDSMAPTIERGDRVLTVRDGGAGGLGDIVIFDRPEAHPGAVGDLISRIVAVEGDIVGIAGGQVLVDGEASPYVDDRMGSLLDQDRADSVVPDGHVFVVGDNLGASFDSREFGPVPVESISGVVRWVNGGLPSIAEPAS